MCPDVFGAKKQHPVPVVDDGVSPERNGQSDHKLSREQVSPGEGGGSIKRRGKNVLLFPGLG